MAILIDDVDIFELTNSVHSLTENTNGMHRSYSFEHLLRETLVVHIRERLFALNNVMQITIHQLDTFKILKIASSIKVLVPPSSCKALFFLQTATNRKGI